MAGIELNNQLADQQKQRIVFSNDRMFENFPFIFQKDVPPKKRFSVYMIGNLINSELWNLLCNDVGAEYFAKGRKKVQNCVQFI